MDPFIGRMLDNRYEILERIGIGGMAVVYKAKCHRLDRLVAIKVLKSDLAQDEDFRRRFNAESQAVARLSSPNIVSVYDVSKGGETEYIVMELIEGITLKQYIQKRGVLYWGEALHFMLQIMRGLSHAHSRGIIHRDIKPQNIMVLRDGSVKVADFGIACLENSAQTLTQQALGSVHYISPEQAKGERTDCRSDIYSAGVVLYEMLTGRLPFEGESAVSIALQHLSSIPVNPRSINPDIPEQLELICLKAMAAEPDRRYSSADEMIRDMEAFRRDPSVTLNFQMSDLRPDVADEPTIAIDRLSEPVRRPVAEPIDDEDDLPEPLLWTPRRVAQFCAGGLAAVVLLLLLVRSVFGSFLTEKPAELHMVKSVLGYTVEEARGLDGVRDVFEIREEGSEPSDDYPVGIIVRQDPAPDKYRKGDNLVIRVWVSSGEEVPVMPGVVNQTVAQVEMTTLRNLIQEYDLTIEASEEDMVFDDRIPSGHIIASIPEEGEALEKGGFIRLILSKGAATWELTPFIGLNYFQEVSRQLAGLKLVPGEILYDYSQEPVGTILSQDPEPLTPVRDGTTVNFIVSRGPDPMAPLPARSTAAMPVPVSTEYTDFPDEEEPGGDVIEEPPSVTVDIPLPEARSYGDSSGYLEVYLNGERSGQGRRVDCKQGIYPLTVFGPGEFLLQVYWDSTEIYNNTVIVESVESPEPTETAGIG